MVCLTGEITGTQRDLNKSRRYYFARIDQKTARALMLLPQKSHGAQNWNHPLRIEVRETFLYENRKFRRPVALSLKLCLLIGRTASERGELRNQRRLEIEEAYLRRTGRAINQKSCEALIWGLSATMARQAPSHEHCYHIGLARSRDVIRGRATSAAAS